MADPHDLKTLEAPLIEEMNARSELATLQSLHDSIPHEGARAAIHKDIAPAQRRLDAAIAGRSKHADNGITQRMIDAAAQREIDARKE
jgi:hypothetical protein